MSYFVYILRCGDGTLYTGSTNDVDKRVKAHNSGKGAKYTKRRLPVRLAYREELGDKSAALKREYAIKQLTREEKLALISAYQKEGPTVNKEFLQVMNSRRSIKAYKPDPVPEELVDAVMEAGTYAPSAMGRQSATIVCVRDKATRDRVAKMNAAVMGADTDPFYGAPVILLVLATGKNALVDGACVLENMLLAAHACGLGGCWINREREMFAGDEGKALLKEWGLSEELEGVGAVALGYPAAPPKPSLPRKADYIVKI